MMLKFGRRAVVSAAVLALAAATIPSRAEADGYFRGGYGPVGNGYRSGGYYAGGGGCGCQVYVPPPPPPCCRVYAPPPCCGYGGGWDRGGYYGAGYDGGYGYGGGFGGVLRCFFLGAEKRRPPPPPPKTHPSLGPFGGNVGGGGT